MKYKVIIILISVTILGGITYFLLVSKTNNQPKDSTNGFCSISINDINEIDQYPEIKEFLMQNGHYEKLLQSIKEIKEIQIRESIHSNKGKLTEEMKSTMIKKYNLDQPNQNKLSSIGITILVEYDSNKIIKDVQLKKEVAD